MRGVKPPKKPAYVEGHGHGGVADSGGKSSANVVISILKVKTVARIRTNTPKETRATSLTPASRRYEG